MNVIEPSKTMASCKRTVQTFSYKPDGNIFVIKGLIHGILWYINVCCSIPPRMTFLFCTSIVKLSDGKMVAKYQTWSYQRISSTDRCYYLGMKVKKYGRPYFGKV